MSRSNKFVVAAKGVAVSARDHNSFWTHLVVSLLVLVIATWLHVELWRWAAVVVAITIVWTAELLNTALEETVKAIHPQPDPGIGRALDAAAGAVLVASVGAIVLGLLSLAGPFLGRISAMI